MNSFRLIVSSMLLSVVLSFSLTVSVYANENMVIAPVPAYTAIEGEWLRRDGGYVIKVSDVQPDGLAIVEYFNPRPINVAEAAISTQKGLVKLFVRFQDKGYEGSTYTLYYYADKDALAGFYYQAATDRTFEVIFIRKASPQY